MNFTRVWNDTRLSSVVAILFFALIGTVEASEKDVIDRYSITAMGKGHLGLVAGRATRLNLVVYRWTTPEERVEIIETLGGSDGKTILKDLEGREIVGRLMVPGQRGVDLRYLWQVEQDGKTFVIGMSERSLLSQPQATTGSARFYVAVFQLELDETGEGKGIMAPGVEPVFYENGSVRFESMIGDPIEFTRVVHDK